jgi:hypothetical protein
MAERSPTRFRRWFEHRPILRSYLIVAAVSALFGFLVFLWRGQP